MKIERARKIWDAKVLTKLAVEVKLVSHKDKQTILSKGNSLKGTGIYKNKDF